jgi:GR25 family glycosyltransferase involved in LPS biosynthesis
MKKYIVNNKLYFSVNHIVNSKNKPTPINENAISKIVNSKNKPIPINENASSKIVNSKIVNSKIVNSKIVNCYQILNEKFDILHKKNSDIIISLTTIPPRFISDTFKQIIYSLYNQILKPKYIVINLCEKYRRTFEYDHYMFDNTIDHFKKTYDNVIINFSFDYGPGTKLLGLLNAQIEIYPEDKIIVIDDVWIYNENMTLIYSLCYQLNNCDCIFIDEKSNITWDSSYRSGMKLSDNYNIFYNNYQGGVFGWLSFSFKYKCLHALKEFYNLNIMLDDLLWVHDDLIFTLYYKHNNLNASGINVLLFNNVDRTDLDDYCALRCESNAHFIRNQLEEKFFKYHLIKYHSFHGRYYIVNEIENKSKFIIQDIIDTRDLLFNIFNIEYNPESNDFGNNHIDFKYINKNMIMMTITFFNKINVGPIVFILNNIQYNINIGTNINNFSQRQTFFISVQTDIIKQPHVEYDFNIIQTSNTNTMSINKFNSILTILSNVPYLKYVFFNDNDREQYIATRMNKLLYIYNKLNVGAYKADFFRALYIYLCGGIYFDCKMILFNDIHQYLAQGFIYTKDIICNHMYNGFFYSIKHNVCIKNYLIEMCLNIMNENYTNDSLSITGPGLFGKFINNPTNYYNDMIKGDWQTSFLRNKNTNRITIKNSFYNYYEEDNYLKNHHYSVLWKNKQVFKNNKDLISYDKINFVDHIVWINLARATERKFEMESKLNGIKIPNTRIDGVDGKYEDLSKFYVLNKKLSNYEIACTLSHIKAISYLANIPGDYFMVCEDDINFEFVNFFDHDLKYIITNSPGFDILLINKIYGTSLDSLYTNWNDIFNRGSQIAGTGCYIITKGGINKILKLIEHNDGNNFEIKTNITNFNVSDVFLYLNTNTWVYKYNFINIDGKDSFIHPNHLPYHRHTIALEFKKICNNLVFI